MRIGFLGAGRMGRPMLARLVAAGHEVRALGRTAGSRAALTELGADAVTTPAEAVRAAEAVVVCLFDDDQVREVCLSESLLTELCTSAVLIVHTTGSPRTVVDIAAAVRTRGAAVVDAPVSGGPHDIARGTLTVFLGGDNPEVTVARELLGAYADPVLHVGPLGAGQRVKLVNNALFAAQLGLVADAVRLGGQLGVPESTLLAALPHASSASRALTGVAAKGSAAAFRASVGEFLRKDITVARALATALGADLGLLASAVDAGTDDVA